MAALPPTAKNTPTTAYGKAHSMCLMTAWASNLVTQPKILANAPNALPKPATMKTAPIRPAINLFYFAINAPQKP